jgi:hypothetical protein
MKTQFDFMARPKKLSREEVSKRWYEKLKADPERYRAYLDKRQKYAKAHYEANKEEINRKDRERFSCPKKRAERAEWQREYRRNNRKHVADRDAAREFGISIEEVQRLRSISNCQICNAELQHYQKGGAAIDHCHKTGKVRGMLCGHCNKGLGLFRDNPATLQQAILYLEERS